MWKYTLIVLLLMLSTLYGCSVVEREYTLDDVHVTVVECNFVIKFYDKNKQLEKTETKVIPGCVERINRGH